MAANSYFGQLFLDLSERIKTEVEEIAWIDQDFGQLELFDSRPAVKFPCALIDFPIANFENLSEEGQLGMINVQIRLGFSPFSQSHHSAPTSVKEKALEYYAIEQKVFEAVHGWGTLYTQPLSRVNTGSEQRLSAGNLADTSGIRVRVLSFATQYEDNSNFRQYIKTPITSHEIETEVNLD